MQSYKSEIKDAGKTSDAPSFSVIVPVYNAEKWLRECLDSILEQTEKSWEAILVDDASTDGSRTILDEYAEKDERLRVIHLKENGGQAAARNRAMDIAKGTWLTFLDADDSWEADFLATCKSQIGEQDLLEFAPRPYVYTTPWSKCVRRNFVEQKHLRFPEGMIYEDVVFSAALWQAGPTIMLSDYRGYHYRKHPQSTTSRPHATKKVRRMLREMGLKPWEYNALRLRLAAYFFKEQIKYRTLPGHPKGSSRNS